MITPQVSVLALGFWGYALAVHLARKGTSVVGWARDEELVEVLRRERHHPKCFPAISFPDALSVTSDLSFALSAPVVVLAFPSAALSEMHSHLIFAPGTVVVSAIKGIESSSLQTPLQLFSKSLDPNLLAVLSGPSFSADIIAGKPAGIVSASVSEATARRVADLFTSDSLKVYYSTDPLGVELGGSLKNIIALAVGVCDGMRLGDSARAGLITRGLAEITRLAVALGADARTLAGLSGLGDLTMTATSDLSRNRRLGLLLGEGMPLASALVSIGSTVESVVTAPIVNDLALRCGVVVPITDQVVKLLTGKHTPDETVRNLLSRPTKPEF